jgi:TolB-like protein
MEADEQATVTTLEVYRAVFRKHIAESDGRVVDTAGDSVLAAFPSTIGAVEAAVAIQAELQDRNAELSEECRMRFRLGVNLGDIIEKDDGSIYGSGVNVAARLEGLAEPSGICLSGSAHEQVEGKMDASFHDIGEHEVKNIARPVRAYRVGGATDQATPRVTLPSRDRPSIAVLPFDNLSGDPEQEYFADGISEDLLTALSRIRWLKVIARNSSFSYKGQLLDIRDIGTELGARYVLEGSVRKGGARVRITAQLIDAWDGQHTWAERFDRELIDIFDVQDEIVRTIAGAIEPEIGLAERERAHAKPPENLDAWDLYQRGMWHMWQYARDDNARAQALFREAIALDPNLAAAHANLAHIHFLDAVAFLGDSVDESIDQAITCARRAVAIDDKEAIGHWALGRANTARGLIRDAIAELRIALNLNPNFALARYALGFACCVSGQPEEGLPHIREAKQLSPFDPQISIFEAIEGLTLISLGEYTMAEELAGSATRRPRTTFYSYVSLASALGHLGRDVEAKRALAKLMEMNPHFSLAWWDRTWVGTSPVFRDPFFEGLYKAGLADPDSVAASE